MYHNLKKNKKGSYYKGRKILFLAITAALSTFSVCQAQAETNIFADIPLYLQNSSTITTAYSVKPNITLLLDLSGSMKDPLKNSYKCRHKIAIGTDKRGKIVWSKTWSEYQFGFDKKPDDTNEFKYDCKNLTKLESVKEILLLILDDYRNNMYFAYRPLVYGNDKNLEFIDTSIPEQYNKLTQTIKNATATTVTPLTEQTAVVARNLVMNKLKYRCQKSYLVILTDGESNNHYATSDADVDGYFDAGTNKKDRDSFFQGDTYGTKIQRLKYYTNTLATKNFGPYIYSAPFYREDGKKIYLASKRTTDEAGQPWNAINPLTKQPFEQKAETFTIGVGLGQKHNSIGNTAIDYLENGAMPAGNFYNANSQNEILEAFGKIFESIKGSQQATTTTTTSTAPSVAISSSEQNQLSITAITESGAWSSKLCIRKITDNNSSQCAQPSYGNRQLLLNNGTNTYLYSANLSAFKNDDFKIANNNGKNQSEWANGLLAWLSRSKDDASIKTDNFVLDYRQRTDSPIAGFGGTRDMGDIIDNPIITAGNLDGGLQKYLVTSANDGMVYVFSATNDANHPYDLKFNFMPMSIERQSNDGSDLVSHYYKDLTHNEYGKNSEHPHRFLLNGGMVVQQTEKRVDSKGKLLPQQTFMLSNMGQAGRGAFAINIGGNDLVSKEPVGADNTGSNGWYKDVSLFQTPTGNKNLFGFTVGTPAIARLRVNEDVDASPTSVANHIREAAFISNGYNYSGTLASNNASHASLDSVLYIYDILGVDVGTDGFQKTGYNKGELIATLAPEQNPDSDERTGGLSSPTVLDIDGDGVADIVYAGDYSGNLYRFDLRSPDPSQWTVHKIFSAGAPITSAPGAILVEDTNNNGNNNSKNPTVIVTFGTGSDVYQSDLNNKDQQTVYGIYDNLNVKAPAEISKQALLKQQLTASGNYRMLSDNKFDPKVHRGWYFNLDNTTGERVVSKPIVISYAGVVFSRAYDVKKDNKLEDPCQVTERKQESDVYSGKIQYNIKTGGRLKRGDPNIEFDPNAPFGAALTVKGLYGLALSNSDTIKGLDIGTNGTQGSLIPDPDAKKEECSRTPVFGVDSNGNKIIINIPKCSIKFKRLSWREVKNNYTS
ncbi:hypothetical protein GY065_07170 [Snodgrassella sp. ESL0323]|uniref:PilC/PilY family type IV pilus protein n=1 Tax=Snodgrassella sp. ESL0323 TaxID=2705034 RepID=UPI00158286CE|nr:PilC/PilY family type IV pilus protein [Snodgrassella sp. ESL0323]NUF78689.1 hypothetical protein [Snodgrassella sp. ESL0323]